MTQQPQTINHAYSMPHVRVIVSKQRKRFKTPVSRLEFFSLLRF